MRRVRRLWAVAAAASVAALVLLPAAPQAAEDAAKLPPYLTATDAKLSLNDQWHGTGRVPGVPVQSTLSEPGDPGDPVWGFDCAQPTATFTRTVELLGPAHDGEFAWSEYVTPGTTWPGMTSLTVTVNGALLYHWARPASPDTSENFTTPQLTHLKPGANSIVVKATRAPLPAGLACNRRGAKLTIALQATFDFEFSTDLRVGVPAKPTTVVKADASEYHQVIQEFVENKGPDRAVNGYISAYYSGSDFQIVMNHRGGPSLCEHVSNTQWFCRFDELDPGERLTVLARVVWKPPAGLPNWDHQDASVTFTSHSDTPDQNSSNDSVQPQIIFCQTTSTLPQCK